MIANNKGLIIPLSRSNVLILSIHFCYDNVLIDKLSSTVEATMARCSMRMTAFCCSGIRSLEANRSSQNHLYLGLSCLLKFKLFKWWTMRHVRLRVDGFSCLLSGNIQSLWAGLSVYKWQRHGGPVTWLYRRSHRLIFILSGIQFMKMLKLYYKRTTQWY